MLAPRVEIVIGALALVAAAAALGGCGHESQRVRPLALDAARDGAPVLAPGFRVIALLRGERGEHVGYALTTLGDVDGDHKGELLVGSVREAQPRRQRSGFVRIFSPALRRCVRELRSSDELGLDGFGERVAVIGDVDADGVNDFAIAASDACEGRGAVEVHSGASGARTCRIEGVPPGETGLGRFLVSVGDIDGDGRNDLGVVCDGPRSLIFDARSGASIATFDGTLRAASGDLDGDGKHELFVYDGEPRTRALTWDGPPRRARVVKLMPRDDGAERVSVATLLELSCGADARRIDAQATADVDRDGFSDWIVALELGDPAADESWRGGERERRVRVFSGRDAHALRDFAVRLPARGRIHFVGLVADIDGDGQNEIVVAWHLDEGTPQGVVELRRASDGELRHTFTSTNWSFGASACALPDIDGDGRPELALGEFETALPARGCGAVYVVGVTPAAK